MQSATKFEPDLDQVRQIVREVVMEVLELDSEELADDADFVDDYHCDSLKRLELVVTLEKRFKVRYPVSQADKMHSVDSVVDVTAARLAPEGEYHIRS